MGDPQRAGMGQRRVPGRAIDWGGPVAHVKLALGEPPVASPEYTTELPTDRGFLAGLNPLLMLLVGLIAGAAIGFAGRPLVMPPAPAPAVALNAGPEATPPESDVPAAAPAETAPATVSPEEQQAQREAVMAQLVSQTRHFQGDPDAPVTIIEFSDFQ